MCLLVLLIKIPSLSSVFPNGMLKFLAHFCITGSHQRSLHCCRFPEVIIRYFENHWIFFNKQIHQNLSFCDIQIIVTHLRINISHIPSRSTKNIQNACLLNHFAGINTFYCKLNMLKSQHILWKALTSNSRKFIRQ